MRGVPPAADTSEAESLPKPVRFFDRAAPWLGTAVMVVALYYDLERETEVNLLIYGIAGGLMGLGAAIRQVVKPA